VSEKTTEAAVPLSLLLSLGTDNNDVRVADARDQALKALADSEGALVHQVLPGPFLEKVQELVLELQAWSKTASQRLEELTLPTGPLQSAQDHYGTQELRIKLNERSLLAAHLFDIDICDNGNRVQGPQTLKLRRALIAALPLYRAVCDLLDHVGEERLIRVMAGSLPSALLYRQLKALINFIDGKDSLPDTAGDKIDADKVE
jgi:hypothetical protein